MNAHPLTFKSVARVGSILLAALLLTGCTVHPDGERHERELASTERTPFARPVGNRVLPALPDPPTPDDFVRYGLLASPELEQRYWEWKAAIEQIPQDGTQPTNLVLYAGVPISNGSLAFNRTTVTVANDPMADIQWPSKPATAAERALEEARASGLRFQQAKFNLRQKTLTAYYEYALGAELVRLQSDDSQLLTTEADVAESVIASNTSTQSKALSARNEAELSANQLAELQSRLPGLRAALNSAIGRDPAAPISPPRSFLATMGEAYDADTVLKQIEHTSPELAALAAEARSKENAIKLAKLQYVPDFSLSGTTDLGGVAQSLMVMATVPLLRYQAINGAIAQAEANLHATEAMRRQTIYDLQTRLIADLSGFDDLHRQQKLLEDTVIPRAEAMVAINQSAYEGGRLSLTDFLESKRSVLALRRLDINLRVAHSERLIDIESIIGQPISAAEKVLRGSPR